MSKYEELVMKAKALLEKENSVLNYAKLYTQLKEAAKKEKNVKEGDVKKRIKISITGSFTLDKLKEAIGVKCMFFGLFPEIYESPYNQYNQEILNEKSGLYVAKPNLSIVIVDTRTILGNLYFSPYRHSSKDRRKEAEKIINQHISLIETLSSRTDGKIVVNNFEVPERTERGIIENKEEFGLQEMVKWMNNELEAHFRNDNKVFVFDFESFCSRLGKKNVIDYKMYYVADMKLAPEFMLELAEEYMAYVKPLKSKNRKCLVIDMDNTLWGGIVGEDGFEGIQLGPKPPGNAFLDFQKYILSLFERGIILAINSKNNYEDGMKVLREHPYMVLREKNFASMRINWNDKVSNMREIAEEIGIGTDSLVFVDDSPVERELIKEMMPEVLVIELPEDPALYAETLKGINDFNTLQMTADDKKRGKMYAEQRKRKRLEQSSIDLDNFLKNLEMKLTIKSATSFTIPRLAQLTQKTNQFNMTTRRYTEEDIKKFKESKEYLIKCVQVADKFGDNGITGEFIIEKQGDKFRIDTFLLSCRVLGRKVEETLLAYIVQEAKKKNVKHIIGEFIPTKKNPPAKDFFKEHGFEKLKEDKESTFWKLDVEKQDGKFPEFADVKIEK